MIETRKKGSKALKYRNITKFGFGVLLALSLQMDLSWASSSVQEISDAETYAKGVQLRQNGQYTQAIAHFQSLAERNDVKAQHNMGSCYTSMGQLQDAYVWFKRAADRGFELSIRNLQQFSLWSEVLPQDVWSQVMARLSMADVSAVKNVSSRLHQVATDTIAKTDFYHDAHVFAQEWRQRVIADVTFVPEPRALRLAHFFDSSIPIMLIRFRNSQHLRSLSRSNWYCKQERNLGFYRDENTKDGEEFAFYNPGMSRKQGILVDMDQAVTVTGKLGRPYIFFRTNDKGWNGNVNAHVMRVSDLSCAAYLADQLDTCSQEKLSRNLLEFVTILHESRQRINNDLKLKKWNSIVEEMKLFSSQNITINFSEVIKPEKYIVFLTENAIQMNYLVKNYETNKINERLIRCVDPTQHFAGILHDGNLELRSHYEIYCEGDLAILGEFRHPDSDFTAVCKGNCFMDVVVDANFHGIRAETVLRCHTHDSFKNGRKPEDMSSELWKLICQMYEIAMKVQRAEKKSESSSNPS
ncbi:MAG: tetratricopeptide repeat protein [Holosporales bacterium]